MAFIILAALSILFAREASADIYSYTTEDGVVSFTDTPLHREAVLIMKDRVKELRGKQRPTLVASTKEIDATQSPRPFSRLRELPVAGRISSVTGLRIDPFTGSLKHHQGVDIAIPTGTSVRTVASGVVSYSGSRFGYGNLVIIEHHDGMTTLYAHNHSNLVATGATVDRGAIIALSGSTGRSTGPHLHFEAWYQGVNITNSFLTNHSYVSPSQLTENSIKKPNPLRKVTMADGSILLTNLPLIHP
jgi:murein DD-endopeptidase MepM/ murein hydrolase activator NlpD